MSEAIETVRKLIEEGHTLEAAAHVKRLEPVPLSEPVARQLLSMLADAILNPVSRGRGNKFDSDPFRTFGVEHSIAKAVKDLHVGGMKLEEAFEIVGSERHKSAKTVERIYRKLST